jgi:hypothetical protein
VFVDGAQNVELSGLHFDQVDGNGVFFSRFVRNSSCSFNDFSNIGDTAILVVGASGRHRTNQAASQAYPAYNTIESNHVNGVGVWGKQSAAYYKSITRSNFVRNNVFYNSPRSLVNYNDCALGGELLSGNLLFNSESSLSTSPQGVVGCWQALEKPVANLTCLALTATLCTNF